MQRRLLSTAAALVLALAAAAPAPAQTPMDDPLDARDAKRVERMEKVVRELRAIVFQGRDSGKPVVVQPAETDFQIQELMLRLADMEQTLTRVNGQLETQTFQLDQARRALDAARADNKALAERITAIETRLGPTPEEAAKTASAQTPAEAFDAARQLMLNGDYDAAETAWAAFVEVHGDSAKGAEGRYWYGKTLAARSAHAEAATAYIGAIRGWPATGWAPDATLELSRELVALKKTSEACATVGELERRYPKAPAAIKTKAKALSTQAKCG